MNDFPLILASSSESRLKLLKQISIFPDKIFPANINEDPLKNELPQKLAERLACEKAKKVCESFSDGFILGADTVTACGRRVVSKAENDEDVRKSLTLLSGRRHKVYTGITICKIQNKEILKISSRLVTTILKFKRLTLSEIENYVESKEGIGKGGGCHIEGIMESFIIWMSGSYSNVIGLPLYETRSMLYGMGYSKSS